MVEGQEKGREIAGEPEYLEFSQLGGRIVGVELKARS